jgi:capsular polysaccharide biosynthesis protein
VKNLKMTVLKNTLLILIIHLFSVCLFSQVQVFITDANNNDITEVTLCNNDNYILVGNFTNEPTATTITYA